MDSRRVRRDRRRALAVRLPRRRRLAVQLPRRVPHRRAQPLLIQTFEFSLAPGQVGIDTTRFEEIDGRTRLSLHEVYPSVEARDMAGQARIALALGGELTSLVPSPRLEALSLRCADSVVLRARDVEHPFGVALSRRLFRRAELRLHGDVRAFAALAIPPADDVRVRAAAPRRHAGRSFTPRTPTRGAPTHVSPRPRETSAPSSCRGSTTRTSCRRRRPPYTFFSTGPSTAARSKPNPHARSNRARAARPRRSAPARSPAVNSIRRAAPGKSSPIAARERLSTTDRGACGRAPTLDRADDSAIVHGTDVGLPKRSVIVCHAP